ncbi:hypothetical protein PR048_018528 [Dryococelus australis]|uniref:Transposase n=1 Tax=Dryococelus australis TaxID=614101 RepID=A0ABQ9HCS8_9NEOP|nr:hypothetical protein PR048_018528 [Dryococelus australis]
MLELWLMAQLEIDSEDFILQLDGAPPHFHRDAREFLNHRLPNQWIGHSGNDNQHLLSWPPCSPDLTPCDNFFFVGLWARIVNAFDRIDRDMLYNATIKLCKSLWKMEPSFTVCLWKCQLSCTEWLYEPPITGDMHDLPGRCCSGMKKGKCSEGNGRINIGQSVTGIYQRRPPDPAIWESVSTRLEEKLRRSFKFQLTALVKINRMRLETFVWCGYGKSKDRDRMRLETASQKQSSDTHKTPYVIVKRCRERKINIKASERVNVDVFTQYKRPCPVLQDVLAIDWPNFERDSESLTAVIRVEGWFARAHVLCKTIIQWFAKHFTYCEDEGIKKYNLSDLNSRMSVEQGEGNGRSQRKPADQCHRPGTIPTCENPGSTAPGMEPGSPRWEASGRATTPQEPPENVRNVAIGTYNHKYIKYFTFEEILRPDIVCVHTEIGCATANKLLRQEYI